MNFIDRFIRAVFTPFLKLFHKELTEKQWESLLQFIKFCLVGVTNTAISYCLNAHCHSRHPSAHSYSLPMS